MVVADKARGDLLRQTRIGLESAGTATGAVFGRLALVLGVVLAVAADVAGDHVVGRHDGARAARPLAAVVVAFTNVEVLLRERAQWRWPHGGFGRIAPAAVAVAGIRRRRPTSQCQPHGRR